MLLNSQTQIQFTKLVLKRASSLLFMIAVERKYKQPVYRKLFSTKQKIVSRSSLSFVESQSYIVYECM